MKRTLLAIAVASLSLNALADGELGFDPRTVTPAVSTKTRAQVLAELIAWKQSGDYFIANTGLKAYQLWPSYYPAPAPRAAGKSRAEVLAELVEARRSGDFVVDGELGVKANQRFPGAYRAPVMASGEQEPRL